jgi:quinol monooxygenase YgiN
MSGIGTFTRWVVRPGKDAQAGDLLRDALPLVMLESGTLAWFPLRFNASEFGVFACFPDLASLLSHLDGPAHRILQDKAPLVIDGEPQVNELDVLAEKLPAHWSYGPITQGLLLDLKVKPDQDLRVRELLSAGLEEVQREAGTSAWFALRINPERYASFAVFADKRARYAHLTGTLETDLARHALSLLGGLPKLEMPRVLAAKLLSPIG